MWHLDSVLEIEWGGRWAWSELAHLAHCCLSQFRLQGKLLVPLHSWPHLPPTSFSVADPSQDPSTQHNQPPHSQTAFNIYQYLSSLIWNYVALHLAWNWKFKASSSELAVTSFIDQPLACLEYTILNIFSMSQGKELGISPTTSSLNSQNNLSFRKLRKSSGIPGKYHQFSNWAVPDATLYYLMKLNKAYTYCTVSQWMYIDQWWLFTLCTKFHILLLVCSNISLAKLGKILLSSCNNNNNCFLNKWDCPHYSFSTLLCYLHKEFSVWFYWKFF